MHLSAFSDLSPSIVCTNNFASKDLFCRYIHIHNNCKGDYYSKHLSVVRSDKHLRIYCIMMLPLFLLLPFVFMVLTENPHLKTCRSGINNYIRHFINIITLHKRERLCTSQ